MRYNLELDKAARQIKEQGARLVCVQLPDGLKPEAESIAKALEHETGAKVVTWLGSCFGACDVPTYVDALGVDLLIQFGHSEWKTAK
jgi:diphthamide biosynthesis enzyme Dph1/Dph2-like protein